MDHRVQYHVMQFLTPTLALTYLRTRGPHTNHTDLILTSLLYDTFIYLANLLIVFQDGRVSDMVVDVLALEFFTLIDDEFKNVLLEYDSSFLSEMVVTARPAELLGPQRESQEYAWYTAETVGGHPPPPPPHAVTDNPDTCCDLAEKVVLSPIMLALLIVRAACRIGGPICAFVMIFYGPICLGPPGPP